jgi:ectoine hydroxylase-related dioxygenase (phytanoyl-CoA dioxygenase family)
MFPQLGQMMWLDRNDAEELIHAAERSGYLSEYGVAICRQFSRDGYCVIENAISEEDCDRVWDAFEIWTSRNSELVGGAIPTRVVPEFGRVVNVHRMVPQTTEILHHPVITSAIEMLLGFKCIPFQTIPSFFGSEQPAHSDAIHMTTFPFGFLAAAWIALEDIAPDSGPLVYYPGSHKLPYTLSNDVAIAFGEFAREGRIVYETKYEPAISELLKKNRCNARYFTPKKGDVLIWHHNLIHGGSAVNNRTSSRKSIVCHYYADTVLCYHDLINQISDVDSGVPPHAEILDGLRVRSRSRSLVDRL